MSTDTEFDDINIDQENDEEVLESTDELEHSDEDNSDDSNDELQKLRSENKKLVDIIKRRKERDGSATQSITKTPQSSSSPTREEMILIAKGYEEEDLDLLNALAKGNNVSIKEAQENPLFQAYIEKKEREKKNKKAQLGASKGSSTAKPVSMSGMSQEDHMKLWREMNGME